jgi:hypothetical protein
MRWIKIALFWQITFPSCTRRLKLVSAIYLSCAIDKGILVIVCSGLQKARVSEDVSMEQKAQLQWCWHCLQPFLHIPPLLPHDSGPSFDFLHAGQGKSCFLPVFFVLCLPIHGILMAIYHGITRPCVNLKKAQVYMCHQQESSCRQLHPTSKTPSDLFLVDATMCPIACHKHTL